jgi:hypothetical protein
VINLTLRVTTTDGTTNDYAVSPRVQVAFEREFKLGLPQAFTTQQKMEHIYWLSWKAQQSSGAVVKPFDGWLETVESVEMIEAASPLS